MKSHPDRLPYIHTDYNRAPFSVGFYRITPSGRPTMDWHLITIYRYNKSEKLTRLPKDKRPDPFSPYAREYTLSSKYGHVRTLADIPADVITPPRLPTRKGSWSTPIFHEFTPTEAESFPPSFLATNSGAL